MQYIGFDQDTPQVISPCYSPSGKTGNTPSPEFIRLADCQGFAVRQGTVANGFTLDAVNLPAL